MLTRRLSLLLAITLPLTIGLPACGDDDPATDLPVATVDPTSEATALASQFDQTLRALNLRYEFVTSVETNGAAVSEISGRNIDGNATSTTKVATNTIDLLSVGDAYWTRSGAGDWTAATGAPLSHDPLESLLAVTQVTVLEGVMTIELAGAVLGLEIDWVSAEVTVTGAAIELVAEANGLVGRIRLQTAADLTPITAPV